MAIKQFSLFKSDRFWPLFLTHILGKLNNQLFKGTLVLGGFAAGITKTNSELMPFTALVAGLFILPLFLFSATGGQLTDKYEKSYLIRRLKAFELVSIILLSFGLVFSNYYLLLAASFLLGSQTALFTPLKYSLLPEHIEERALIGGNGLMEAGAYAAVLLVTLFTVVTPNVFPAAEVTALAMTLIAALGLWAAYKVPPATASAPDLELNINVFAEVLSLFKIARKREVTFLAILGIGWFWFVATVFLAQFPSYAQSTLGADGQVITLFLIIFASGVSIGALLCNFLLRGLITARYVPLAAIFMALFCLDLYSVSKGIVPVGLSELGLNEVLISGDYLRVGLDLLGISVAAGFYVIPLQALLQARSPRPQRGRMIAVSTIVNAAAVTVSSAVTFVWLRWDFSVPHVFLMLSVISGFVALTIVRLLPQDLIQSIARSLFRLFYRVEVKGFANYQKVANKAVIIANHTSYLDGLLLGAFLPHQLSFAINTNIADKWWVKPVFAFFNLLPVDPTNPMATKALVSQLKKGRRIVIFPEGRLTVTGALMKIYEGPGAIAHLANAPLLPIRIEGAQYSMFSRLKGIVKLRFFPKITLIIEQPTWFKPPEKLSSRERRTWLAEALYEQMSCMMFNTSNRERTLFESLLDARRLHGGGHKVIEDVERNPISYNRLILGAFILGRRIKKGTRARDNVGLFLPNSVGAVVTFFALQAFGRVPAMLNYSAGIKNIKAACTAAKITTILTSKRFIELGNLEEAEAALEQHYKLVYLEDIREKIGIFDKLFGMFAKLAPEYWYRRLSSQATPEEPGIVLFTSGSEGIPKGVVHSHKSLQSNRMQLSARVDFSPADTIFNALPIFHTFGMTGGLLLPVLSGLKTFLYPSPLHYRIVPELVYDTNATIMFGTDTFLSGYAKFAHPYDFYSMRYIFAGAEKLKPDTRRLYANKFGVRVFEGYGATETAPVLAVNTPMHAKNGTVGRLLPGIKHKIIPVPGIEKGGKLIVSGPNVMMGYLRADKPGELEPAPDGWYDTGDIVEIDEAGFVKIVGRAKRFAKIAGEMVSLTAVESAASALWPDSMHAVVAVNDDKKGEQLVLISSEKSADRSTFFTHLKTEGLSELMAPKHVKIVDEIPVLGTGKTDYVTVQLLADEFAT